MPGRPSAAALTGALGAAVLGLAVFARVRRETARRGVPVIVGTQALYLSLWTFGGLLWPGSPRELPHFASPVQLNLKELQGRWTREDGQVYEVQEPDGRLGIFVDGMGFVLSIVTGAGKC